MVVFTENIDAMNKLVHFPPVHESKSFSKEYVIITNSWKGKDTKQSE